jgi:hypothetical protein
VGPERRAVEKEGRAWVVVKALEFARRAWKRIART